MKIEQDKIKITAEIKVCYDALESSARRFPRSVARKTLGAMFLAMLDEEISMLQANPVAAALAMNELVTMKQIIDRLVDNAPIIMEKFEKPKKPRKNEKTK